MNDVDFVDPRAVDDFATFVARAAKAQPNGAVRLQVLDGLLVTTVSVLDGGGLLRDGLVLGVRVSPIRYAAGPGAATDVTVSFASLTDRLARRLAASTRLSVPPVTVHVPWGGLTPPRDGWERVGVLAVDEVSRIAGEGISQLAQEVGSGRGGHVVEARRQSVWGAMSDTRPPIVAGLAFGAHVLGFVSDEDDEAVVTTAGRWTRLSTRRGHVLAR